MKHEIGEGSTTIRIPETDDENQRCETEVRRLKVYKKSTKRG